MAFSTQSPSETIRIPELEGLVIGENRSRLLPAYAKFLLTQSAYLREKGLLAVLLVFWQMRLLHHAFDQFGFSESHRPPRSRETPSDFVIAF